VELPESLEKRLLVRAHLPRESASERLDLLWRADDLDLRAISLRGQIPYRPRRTLFAGIRIGYPQDAVRLRPTRLMAVIGKRASAGPFGALRCSRA